MRYLSVCSGIEAATAAWHPLGWEPAAFSEIGKFPAAVLVHHYPSVPNLGDMTNYKEWSIGDIDLLVGGTPCQSFSVAGLRKGLADPRGNLCLVYLGVAERFRPRWILWENVPGVLSSGRGRDFGSFLGAMAELGYGWAYRILDAQYCGVPQRRCRVFVVGYLGDWRRAAAVLFERHSLSGNPPPSREKREVITPSVAQRLRSGGDGGVPSSRGENLVWGIDEECNATADRTRPLLRGGQGGTRQAVCTVIDRAAYNQGENAKYAPFIEETETMPSLISRGPHAVCMAHGQGGAEIRSDGSPSLTCNHEAPIVCHGSQDPCVSDNAVFALGWNNGRENAVYTGPGFIHPRQCRGSESSNQVGINPEAHISDALTAEGLGAVLQKMQVRRLTPKECERLQGFPDEYTKIPWRGKPAEQCPDGPRYKALGNSMAVPCMRWLGERIEEVDQI